MVFLRLLAVFTANRPRVRIRLSQTVRVKKLVPRPLVMGKAGPRNTVFPYTWAVIMLKLVALDRTV